MAVTVYLSPLSAIFQYLSDLGVPLSGGKVNTYVAGSSTPQATYTDATGVTPNANPLILGSNGRLQNVQIWQPIGVKIKAIITDSNNNQLGPVFDQVPGIGDPTALTSVYYGGTDTGAANAYVLTIANAGFSSYGSGLVIYWIPSHGNSGASTININGLGAVNITNVDGSALVSGQLVANQLAVIVSQGGNFVLTSLSTTSGSFTPNWTGFSVAPTGTMSYQITGNQVTLEWTGGQGTSNATSMSINNFPNGLMPTSRGVSLAQGLTALIDNSAGAIGTYNFTGLSTLSFNKGTSPPSATGFTNSGTKGLDTGWSLTYLLK